MTGAGKAEFSPKKGKENTNVSNHLPRPTVTVTHPNTNDKLSTKKVKESPKKEYHKENNDRQQISEGNYSTSKKSVRPQTKVLRRPTPNLQHPVIQSDSDDSICSDKSKDDNPKRLKTSNDSSVSSESSSASSHKIKNFIIYNKNNVEKNTKQAIRERNSANLSASIPNPCTSCNRSQAPERLHSHAKKDARGLMCRRSPSLETKVSSLQKKTSDIIRKNAKSHEDLKDIVVQAPEIHIKDTDDTQDDRSLRRRESPTNKRPGLLQMKSFEDLQRPCYICSEKLSISSLLLHESKCLENWKKVNNSLTPNLRKLPPRRPLFSPEVSSPPLSPRPEEDINIEPEWSEVQSQLEPCSLCGRTFFPERLPIHRRVCKGKSSPKLLKRASSLREKSASSFDGDDSKPASLYVPCWICGRNFGSWVIAMHEQQCLKKSKKEKCEQKEDQELLEPTTKSPGLSSDEDVTSLIELGNNAWESHLQQLIPCPRCTRTFFPDRLGVHKRSCKGTSNIKRPGSNRGT